MRYRSWHAQLDAYDTLRRYLAILDRWKTEGPSKDRLFVSDFYFVNPALLHNTNMTHPVRKSFSELKITRPEKTFIRHPSPSLLYVKMAGIQSEALHNLTGRGLCDLSLANRGIYELSQVGREFVESLRPSLVLPREEPLLSFIVDEFSTLGLGKGGLRSVTGLRRMGT